MSDRFLVDLDQLDAVVTRLGRDHAALERLRSSLDVSVALLHEEWDGAASASHAEAQARWDAGFATMRRALARMRAAAAAARDNYTAAAEANVSMWRGLG